MFQKRKVVVVMRKYEHDFFEWFKKGPEGEYIFGPRIARAVSIWALTGGPEFVYQNETSGLPFSYRELKILSREAVKDAVTGVTIGDKLVCSGIGALLNRIESILAGEHDDGHFDEARKITKRLNAEVFADLCVLREIHVRKPPIVAADGRRWVSPYTRRRA